MKTLEFSIDIEATKEEVWKVLWTDAAFRDWADLIDPGTYMIGKLEEGSEVQFISAEGYGVTSLVAEVALHEYVLLRHRADTKDSGTQDRVDQWSGGKESYRLTQSDGGTNLTITFDVPLELEEVMSASYPKALQRIKTLSEL